MELRAVLDKLKTPEDVAKLTSILSEMADALDVVYSTTAPNGSISGRQGQLCLYNNSGTYTLWINTTGSTVWAELTSQSLWQIDGTETQLKTADEIDMQSKKIINVTDPTSDQEAATKAYADTKAAKGANADITSLSGLTTALSVAQGGTGYTAGTIARIKTGTYAGDGAATKAITGVGFQAKVVMAFGQNTTEVAATAVKTDQDGTYTSFFGNANLYQTDHIVSLDSDGFTVGDGTGSANRMNESGKTYTYIAWG